MDRSSLYGLATAPFSGADSVAKRSASAPPKPESDCAGSRRGHRAASTGAGEPWPGDLELHPIVHTKS